MHLVYAKCFFKTVNWFTELNKGYWYYGFTLKLNGKIKMKEIKEPSHIPAPKKIWLIEQADDKWISWSGTEQELRDFIGGDGIPAYEYVLTGNEM